MEPWSCRLPSNTIHSTLAICVQVRCRTPMLSGTLCSLRNFRSGESRRIAQSHSVHDISAADASPYASLLIQGRNHPTPLWWTTRTSAPDALPGFSWPEAKGTVADDCLMVQYRAMVRDLGSKTKGCKFLARVRSRHSLKKTNALIPS
jgi:hypothetical protein